VDQFVGQRFSDDVRAGDGDDRVGRRGDLRFAVVRGLELAHPRAVGLHQDRVRAPGFGYLADDRRVVPAVAVVALPFGDESQRPLVGGAERVERVLGHRDRRDVLVENRDADRRGHDGAVDPLGERVQRRLLPARADDADKAPLGVERADDVHACWSTRDGKTPRAPETEPGPGAWPIGRQVRATPAGA
jgi:hypothetical protein